MTVVQFIAENTVVLCQLLENIPGENDSVKIKGRKGKVLSTKTTDNHIVQVHVTLEQKVKNQPVVDKKKKR